MAQSKRFTLDRLRFVFSRIKGRLWVNKPLVLCVTSIGGTYKYSVQGEYAFIFSDVS